MVLNNLIGLRIKQAIGLSGLSVSEFCNKVGQSRATLASWINGKNVNIKEKSIDVLCSDLAKVNIACSSDWIIQGIGSTPSIINSEKSDSNTIECIYDNYKVVFSEINMDDINKSNYRLIVTILNNNTYVGSIVSLSSLSFIICTLKGELESVVIDKIKSLGVVTELQYIS